MSEVRLDWRKLAQAAATKRFWRSQREAAAKREYIERWSERLHREERVSAEPRRGERP
jgi:hypothetical protein